MGAPKALVLRTAGTNCEHETVRALTLAGAATDLLHAHRLLEQPARLEGYGIAVFPGGFSYGDDIAAGRVWGLETRTRLRAALSAFVERGGLVLGICNGFQVLVESGIFQPDRAPGERDIALTGNASNHYECRWVHVEAGDCACAWLTPGERFPVPVAHAEGRFVVKNPAALARLEAGRQIALRYVTGPDAAPGRSPGQSPGQADVAYPADPNGSVGHIAGICDPSGRVLGLMPHPERNLDPWNHPNRASRESTERREHGEGFDFYRRMVEAATAAAV